MDCSMPGFPVHHQLPELAQSHVHQVSDAIQPSHPLLSPSPPAFNLSQHQSLFQWVSCSHQLAKVLHQGGLVLPILELSKNWIIQYILFCTRLLSTHHKVLKIHPCCWVYKQLFPFCCWEVFHCIWLYEYTTFCLSILLWMDTGAVSRFCLLWINLLIFLDKYVCGHIFLPLLGIFLGEEEYV